MVRFLVVCFLIISCGKEDTQHHGGTATASTYWVSPVCTPDLKQQASNFLTGHGFYAKDACEGGRNFETCWEGNKYYQSLLRRSYPTCIGAYNEIKAGEELEPIDKILKGSNSSSWPWSFRDFDRFNNTCRLNLYKFANCYEHINILKNHIDENMPYIYKSRCNLDLQEQSQKFLEGIAPYNNNSYSKCHDIYNRTNPKRYNYRNTPEDEVEKIIRASIKDFESECRPNINKFAGCHRIIRNWAFNLDNCGYDRSCGV